MTGTYHYTDNTISFYTEKTASTYFVEFSSNLFKKALLFVCFLGSFGFFVVVVFFVVVFFVFFVLFFFFAVAIFRFIDLEYTSLIY